RFGSTKVSADLTRLLFRTGLQLLHHGRDTPTSPRGCYRRLEKDPPPWPADTATRHRYICPFRYTLRKGWYMPMPNSALQVPAFLHAAAVLQSQGSCPNQNRKSQSRGRARNSPAAAPRLS